MIIAAVIAFHLISLAISVAGVVVVTREPTAKSVVLATASCIGLGTGSALVLGGGFGALRLLSWGLFVYAPLAAIAAGLLLWRQRRRLAVGALTVAALLVAVGIDAFLVEPHWLEVSHVTLESPKVQTRQRVVIIADIQTDEIGEYERGVLSLAAGLRADVVLWPGDYIQVADGGERDRLEQELRQAIIAAGFEAPGGMYAVRGDMEQEGWEQIFAGTGVLAMTRPEQTATTGRLRVTGLDDLSSRDTGLTMAASDEFHIVFGHAPDFALGDVNADLLVAGHTHGGQVRLPFVGPLITLSAVPRSWAAGLTRLDPDRTLVVSRGVGMERGTAPRLRFLCRPELVVVDIVPTGPTREQAE